MKYTFKQITETCNIEHSVESSNLENICTAFEYFLKGCGYSIKDLAGYFEGAGYGEESENDY